MSCLGKRLVPPSARRAFTLVELLVTLAVIAMMASMLLFALSSAQESARDAKTRAMIAKINTLIMRRYEAYRTRRVPIQIPVLPPGVRTQKAAAKMRLDALRQLMRMEMPDRWTDVTDPPISIVDPQTGAGVAMARPSLSQAYLSRYNAAVAASTHPANIPANQSAECLYMIATMGTGSEDVRAQFAEGEIGDVDGDGLPEFLDGWGQPIHFLRWAPGFISELQNGADPDPFDPYHAYPDTYLGVAPYVVPSTQPQPTFALYPLIYSAGSDQIGDIYTGPDSFSYSSNGNNNSPFPAATLVSVPIGFPEDLASTKFVNFQPITEQANGQLNSVDNIHNHLMQTK